MSGGTKLALAATLLPLLEGDPKSLNHNLPKKIMKMLIKSNQN